MPNRAVISGVWLALAAVGALALRLPALDRRPMHVDEANQAVKCGMLMESGYYRYDPNEHHGPTLYYLSLPFAWLTAGRDFAQTTEVSFRILPVLFGCGVILLLFAFRDAVGHGAAVVSALFTALSPAMVFYSRFYIQETLLVFFTFGLIVAGWRYLLSRSTGWALLAGLFAGLMHATKETCVIAYAAMAGALILTVLWGRWRGERLPAAKPLRTGPLLAALGVAAGVSALFFSSFFSNARGPLDSLLTYATYMARSAGRDTVHVHPWFYYLQILGWARFGAGPVWTEGIILVLAAGGCAAACVARSPADPPAGGAVSPPCVRPALLRFLAVYALLSAILYSAIPYKTPWSALSFLHGMILLAGVGAWSLLTRAPGRFAKVALAALLVAGLAHLGLQAHRANGRYRADPRNPYVYAHTSPDFLNLVARVAQIAAVAPDSQAMFIAVVADPHDQWPLPWYLRAFTHVGYWTEPDAVPLSVEPAVAIVAPDREAALRRRLNSAYQTEYYGLRPEVLLALDVRRDLWEAFLRTKAGTANERE